WTIACTPTSSRASPLPRSPRSRGRASRSDGAWPMAGLPAHRDPPHARDQKLRDIASVLIVLGSVIGIGLALGAWTGFPKGTDAYAHLTRLKLVADSFPRHEWLFGWSAGMPAFETYPELPYLAAAPFTKILGAPTTL